MYLVESLAQSYSATIPSASYNENHLEAKYRLPSSGIYNASIELRYKHFNPNNYSFTTPVFYTGKEPLNNATTIIYAKDKHFSEEVRHCNFERNKFDSMFNTRKNAIYRPWR